jgi:hypothetical protein
MKKKPTTHGGPRKVKEYFLERFCDGKWKRSGVSFKSLSQAREICAAPTGNFTSGYQKRIIRVDSIITEQVINFP